jgi:dynactin complex subunit
MPKDRRNRQRERNRPQAPHSTHELEHELDSRASAIRELKKIVKVKTDGMKKKDEEIEVLKKGMAEAEDTAQMQEELMRTGERAVREQRLRVTKLVQQNTALQKSIDDQVEELEAMRDLMVRMQDANGDDFTPLALEFQAQQTLGMVQGLQFQVMELQHAVQTLNDAVAQRDDQISDRQRTSSGQTERMAELEKKAAEAQGIAEDQQVLIGRLMGENTVLHRMSRDPNLRGGLQSS